MVVMMMYKHILEKDEGLWAGFAFGKCVSVY